MELNSLPYHKQFPQYPYISSISQAIELIEENTGEDVYVRYNRKTLLLLPDSNIEFGDYFLHQGKVFLNLMRCVDPSIVNEQNARRYKEVCLDKCIKVEIIK